MNERIIEQGFQVLRFKERLSEICFFAASPEYKQRRALSKKLEKLGGYTASMEIELSELENCGKAFNTDFIHINQDNKTIALVPTGYTPISVLDLYQYLKDYYDDECMMDQEFPLKAETPNQIRLNPGVKIPESDMKWITDGTIIQGDDIYSSGIASKPEEFFNVKWAKTNIFLKVRDFLYRKIRLFKKQQYNWWTSQ